MQRYADPALTRGRSESWVEATGRITLGVAGVGVRTREEGSAEMASGRAPAHRGCNLQGPFERGGTEAGCRATSLAHEPVRATTKE